MSDLLGSAVVDAQLVHYEEDTGEGYFVVVDGDAPAYGAVVKLAGDDGLSVYRQAKAQEPQVTYPSVAIEQYFDDLDRHDWYCDFSDDYSVQRRGSEDYARLKGVASQNGRDHVALLEAFRRHYFSGEPWGTPRWDKPARPVDGVLLLPPEPTQSTPEPSAPGANDVIDVIDASGLVDAQTGTEAKSMPETESAIVDESGKEAGEGKLPGWTLAVHVGMPLLAAAIAVGCRGVGVSWWIAAPVAAAIVIGGLLWERSIERKYLSA
ncbi:MULTISPECIES: hypothetical protein [Burkholderia]|uniref:Uncharacterized protein n=3 Tax=Bacteria TaxID=2 RepID=A0AAP1VDM9_9BURK|nr:MULTISPECIES: hypothetical protein [Burkholderia cepacia complex]ELK7724860.1 hypothetical protein [Burkholderia cenocepacia]UTP27801.1 hypothetical protein NMB33_40660 [Burkholderia sp. FXe9]MBA9833430.1 hypothetical protein [Burkholderia contaminans]MBH9693801.1 hypothetical protein [Burkholderia contaminans]MBK1905460.1 hypothetical protein [Burkholderia contaminans]